MALKIIFNPFTGKFDYIDVSSSGSTSVTEIEVDFGVIPTSYKTFVITDAGISPTSKLIISQSGAASSDHTADDVEMDPIIFSGTPGTGSFILAGTSLDGPVVGTYKVNYIIG